MTPTPDESEPAWIRGGIPLSPGLWPDERSGPWRLKPYFAIVEGRLECVGLEITSVPLPDEPGHMIPEDWEQQPHSLTSTALRSLNLGSKIEVWKKQIAGFDLARARTFQPERSEELLARAAALLSDSRSTRGRPKLTDEELETVASIYLEALAAGRHPRMAVADQLHLSRSAAGKRIHLARRAGYLGRTKPGIAGGLPIYHLEEEDDDES